MDDIEQVPTITLVDELVRRSDCIVLAFDPLSDKDDEIKTKMSGDLHKCPGLCKILDHHLEEIL